MPGNNFRFWIPIDEIKKAKDKDGNETMILGGIASTTRRDTDEEILDPKGFDLSYLNERGILNWNHSHEPEDCIGEPIHTELRKEGLYVKSMLYPDSEKAQKVYKLAETLRKSKGNRRLGYSVEGKATDRDPLDPSNVVRAKITNLALTLSPKNPDSIVDIIKGNYHGWNDNEVPPPLEVVDFETANGGKQYIVDITRPDGTRVTVDSNYNIEVHKAMTTDSSSGKAVTHEHVDGETKDQMNSNLKQIHKAEEDEINSIEEIGLTQDEVIEKILSTDSVISFEKANEIFNALNNLTMANAKTKITDELLEKSLKVLDLKKSNNINDDDNEAKLHRNKNQDESEEEEDLDSADADNILDGDEPKGKKKRPDPVKIGKGLVKAHKKEDEEEEAEEEEKPIKKAVNKKKRKEEDEVEEDEENEMHKAIGDLKEMVKSLAIISKAGYDLSKAQADELAELREQIEEFGNAPAQVRKSVSKGVERDFEKGMNGEDTIEKSADGKVVVDVARARQAVLNMFDTMAFKNNTYNPEIGDAMRLFEASGVVNPSIQKSIENEFGVKLVRRS